MLGAQGALIGTRFLATPEAGGRGHSKDAILNALGSQTTVSRFYDDVLEQVWPRAIVRTIKHPLLEEWAERPYKNGRWPRTSYVHRLKLPSPPETSCSPVVRRPRPRNRARRRAGETDRASGRGLAGLGAAPHVDRLAGHEARFVAA